MGLDTDQAELVDSNRQALNGMKIIYVMSHLVSGELIDDPVNVRQLESLINFKSSFSTIPCSLANSAGSFLGNDFHFQWPVGIALYGIYPFEDLDSPLQTSF